MLTFGTIFGSMTLIILLVVWYLDQEGELD